MTLLNEWKEILKVQITNTKQGIKTSQRKLPIEEDEDCYPPLFNLFSKWGKLLSNFDPASTLVLNFDHDLSPEQLCDLKNNGMLGINESRKRGGDTLTTHDYEIHFDVEIICKSCTVIFSSLLYSIQREKNGKKYIEGVMKNKIVVSTLWRREAAKSAGKNIHTKVVNDYIFDTNFAVGRDIESYITDFELWQKDVEDYLSEKETLDTPGYFKSILDLPVWYRDKYEEGYSDAGEL